MNDKWCQLKKKGRRILMKKEAAKRTSVTGADELEMRKEIGLSNGINDILYLEVKAKQNLLNKCVKFIHHYHNYTFNNLQVIIIIMSEIH